MSDKKERLINTQDGPAGNVNDILTAIDDKIYEVMHNKVKNNAEQQKFVDFKKLIFTYANQNDLVWFYSGHFFAALAGVALPTFTFMFGDIVNGIGTNDDSGVIEQSKRMLYIGVGVFFAAWWYVAFLSVFSERIMLKTKVQYLRAILH